LVSTHCTCKRYLIPRLDALYLQLFVVLACCLVPVLAGCGYTANSTTGPLSVAPDSISFGAVLVGQTATSKVLVLNVSTEPVSVSQLNVSGQSFFVSGQSNLPVTIGAGSVYNFQIGFKPSSDSSYSGQFLVMSASGQQIYEGSISGLGVSSSSSTPILGVSAANLTFGNLSAGSASTQPVTLTSMGTAPVTIDSATVSGTAFTVSGATFPAILNPGQSVTLNVQFDPTATGAASEQLSIQSTSSSNSTAIVHLSGTGTGTAVASPQLTISAASLTFGNVTVDTASTQPVTLTSTGTAPVTINSTALTGTGFAVARATFPLTLNPSQSMTLNVQFDPNATGLASGQLTIQSNSSANGTAVVSLSGTGTAVANPQLTISAASLTFGNVTVNTSSTQPVTLTSMGTAPVTIDSATVSGTAFTVSGATFPAILNPGQSVTLNVQFDPTATGAASGQLTIRTTSSSNSTAIVTLGGTGTAVARPQLTISTASFAFGNVTVDTASTQPVTLTSTGTAPVTINAATLPDTGFTVKGAAFPVTLNPTQSVTLNVQFDPATAGAVTGQLTIQSNSSINGTAVISLTGTGTAEPAALSALSCSNASMTESGNDNCTVTLTAAPRSSGLSVSLASSSAAVTVPAKVVVPANATSAAFTATVPSVTTAQAVTLTASAGSVSKSFALQLSATIASSQLTISPSNLAFGDVTVNQASTLPVTLTSTGMASVTINSGTLTGPAYTMSGATFPVTLNPGLAVTLEVQFDPTTAGAAAGQLIIQNNSSTNATSAISLSGTGENATSAAHQADLSWNAPSSSTVPIVGYNIYRSTGSSSTYQLLNSSLDTQTTYVDLSVQSGSTYGYILESVDSSGLESVPSNEVTATIP
jgi:hypothetical protein